MIRWPSCRANSFTAKSISGCNVKKAIWKNCIFTALGVAVLCVVWLVAHAFVGNDLLLPSFFACLKECGKLCISGAFWTVAFSTFLRVVIAFAISFVFAAIFSLVAYLYPAFARFFSPIIAIFRVVPVLGILLILLVWTNASIAPVLVATLSLFPMLYVAFYNGVLHVDGDLLEMSRVYEVPFKRQLTSLYFPSLLPTAMRESGAALSFGIKLVVSAEVLARTKNSVGNWMQEAQILSQMSLLFALLMLACVGGFVLETAFNFLAHRAQRRLQ